MGRTPNGVLDAVRQLAHDEGMSVIIDDFGVTLELADGDVDKIRLCPVPHDDGCDTRFRGRGCDCGAPAARLLIFHDGEDEPLISANLSPGEAFNLSQLLNRFVG
jgi:hypothetical protein